MIRSFSTGAWLLAAATLLLPRGAAANGLELLPGGTRSVARGGAVYARPEDPMALAHNPAGLAFLPGEQLMLDVDVPFHRMCVDPYGYYGWGVYSEGSSEFGDQLAVDDPDEPTPGATYASSPLPEVCNSGQNLPLPHMAWSRRLGERLAVAAGFVAPTVVTGVRYGGADGTMQTEHGPRPTPTRYSMVEQTVPFALAPAVGVAYRVLPQLSVGATLQIGMLEVEQTAIQNAVSGTQPSTDWLAKLRAKDMFVPALIFSVHAQPTREIDVMAGFRWVDDFRGSGDVSFETNTFHQGAISGPLPFQNDPVSLSSIQVPAPWTAWAGARYAGQLPDGASATGLGDPMDTELWDVELDVSYTFNERASKSAVQPGEDVTIYSRSAEGGGGSSTVSVEDISQFEADAHLRDSMAVRLGGSYSVLPRTLTVHAGGFFETRGMDPAFADIHSFAFRRVGLGIGVVLRLGRIDLRAAYGRIFSETLEVAPPAHEPLEEARPGDARSGFDKRVGGHFEEDGTRTGGTVLEDPATPSPGEADAVAAKTQRSAVSTTTRPERVVNAGKYTAGFHILSVGLLYHF